MASPPMWTEDTVPGGRTLRDACADVWQDASTLLRQHAAMASHEVRERAAGLEADAAGLVGGLVLAHAGALALAAAAALGLHAAGLPAWLASLIVGGILAGAGLGLVLQARARLVARATRRSETLRALADTSEWVRELLRGART